MERQVRFLTEAHSAFEHRQRLVQVPLAQVWPANTPIGNHQADGIIDYLGNTQALFPDGNPLGKRSHVGKAKGQKVSRGYRRKDGLPQVLVALLAVYRGYSAPQGVYGL